MSLKRQQIFFFCLIGYIWPKYIKDDAVLAMIKRSRLRYQIFCVVVFSFFLSKENAVLYYYYYYYRQRKKINKNNVINRFRNDNNIRGTQEQKR